MSGHLHVHRARGSRQLLSACIVYAAVCAAEITASYASGSIALRADAGHMLVDGFALVIAAVAARMGNGAVQVHGNSRADLIGALVNAVLLLGVMLYIALEVLGRLLQPRDVHPIPALIVAIIGLLANIGIFFMLHDASSQNLNMKMARLHVLTDALTSCIAILSNATIMYTHRSVIDPVLSLVIVVLIGRIALRTLCRALRALVTFDARVAS